ncbi:hypothetical protein [Kitasatospora sp. NPDC088134]|uniref:hypothetical protein n=1 Tax=Kitasatospora sp. NPDC088134 TaxID=3364071 RepID=UPI00381EA3CD
MSAPPPPPSPVPTPTPSASPAAPVSPSAATAAVVAAPPPPPDGPAAPGTIEPSVWATVMIVTVLLPAALAALAGQHFAFSRRSR